MSEIVDSHVQMSEMIAAKYPITSIVECGMGTISTIRYLSKEKFPEALAVHSLESNPSWRDTLVAQVKDSRWTYEIVPEREMGKAALAKRPILLLIDSFSIDGRIEILTAIEGCLIPFIVLHDSQHEVYNRYLNTFKYRINTDEYIPSTVVSNIIDLQTFLK